MELSEKAHDAITTLCNQGDSLAKSGNTISALEKYGQAWEALPEPREQWEAATWILAAIGDVQFSLGQFDHAMASFGHALRCAGAMGNPFIHLRLGQSAYELGNMKRADDELTRAYMGAGIDIFKAEDPKYLTRLKGVLKPPAGSNTL